MLDEPHGQTRPSEWKHLSFYIASKVFLDKDIVLFGLWRFAGNSLLPEFSAAVLRFQERFSQLC